MALPPKTIHPNGETEISLKKREIASLVADTFDGKIHIEWDPQAQVTPLGLLITHKIQLDNVSLLLHASKHEYTKPN